MKILTELNSYQIRMKRAYLLIANNLDKPLDIAFLAREAAFSLYHFHRLYRNMLGETVAETHRRLRLERAAGQIGQSLLSITQIALDAGYETPQAFTRAFKAHFSLSPAQYRRQSRDKKPFYCSLSNHLIYPYTTKEIIMTQVILENREKTVIYAVHHVGDYQETYQAFNQIWQWTFSHNLAPQVLYGVGIYYDDPMITPTHACRAEAGVAFRPPYPEATDNVRRIELAAGRYARYRHIGPYVSLPQAYNTFFGQWLPTSGYECVDAPPFEVYVNNPQDTPEDELITDIYVQIREH